MCGSHAAAPMTSAPQGPLLSDEKHSKESAHAQCHPHLLDPHVEGEGPRAAPLDALHRQAGACSGNAQHMSPRSMQVKHLWLPSLCWYHAGEGI